MAEGKRKAVKFVVTLDNGDKVNVTYEPQFMNHLEFRGPISETGYRSEFPNFEKKPSLEEVKAKARKLAQKLWEDNPAKHGIQQKIF
jgi:hypothetical protein